MAKILIIGGSGRTGRHVLEQAAQRGHTVRALVRKPEAVTAPPGVQLVKGTPEKLEDLREAMRGTEAVIVAHNNSRASDNPWAKQINPPRFMTDAAQNILAVMGEQQVKRVVFISAIGVGDSWPTIPRLFRAFIKLSNIKIGYADHDGVEALVRKSDSDWTLVRPVGLSDKAAGALGPLEASIAECDARRSGDLLPRLRRQERVRPPRTHHLERQEVDAVFMPGRLLAQAAVRPLPGKVSRAIAPRARTGRLRPNAQRTFRRAP